MDTSDDIYEILEDMVRDEIGDPLKLRLDLLQKITNNFSKKNLIGCDGYGEVYKGHLGTGHVAVKKLHSAHLIEDETFNRQVDCLMKIRHHNIVWFVGYCADTQVLVVPVGAKNIFAEIPQKLLCFKYLRNGSLSKHLTGEPCGLQWHLCYKIIKGICLGLDYLHERHIIYLDLGPNNILLDDGMMPKIAHFGLSRFLNEERSHTITQNIPGQMGYMAPEYINHGEITVKSDIYSLGVIIGHMVQGRNMGPTSDRHVLVSWVNRLLQDSPRDTEFDISYQQIKACIEISHRCTQPKPEDRPFMHEIVCMLEKTEAAGRSVVGPTPNVQDGIEAQSSRRDINLYSMENNSGGARNEAKGLLSAIEGTGVTSNSSEHIQGGQAEPQEGWAGAAALAPASSPVRENMSRMSAPVVFTLELLSEITKGFSNEDKIGYGAFGDVYRGKLPNGEEIAVKKLRRDLVQVDGSIFNNELHILTSVQHQNIVRFVGYCNATREEYVEQTNGKFVYAEIQDRALCFEYLKKGSLKKHLSGISRGHDWHTRYEIIKGICEGLNYLHNGSEDGCPIYHLDLKPDNILLDENMVPKIADFGLSRLFAMTQSHTTKTSSGTRGYMPPEYINIFKISNKYDVFSLGATIIDIMTGPSSSRRVEYAETSTHRDFIKLVHENWNRRLQQATLNYTSQEADSLKVKTCIEIAFKCMQDDRVKRPTISVVLDTLKYTDNFERSSLLVDQARLVKFGVWGGNGGIRREIQIAPHYLEMVTIYSSDVIHALGFSYIDCNGQHRTAGPWGVDGGSPNKVVIDPSEFLVEVWGTIGPFDGIPDVITSLTLVTNTGTTHGPFGQRGGTPFYIPVQNSGHIAGFFARAEKYVNAIGVYTNQKESHVGLAKVGPWGGAGGSACDIEVSPHRVQSVTIRCSEHVVDSLSFSYSDRDGLPHTAGPWGGSGGDEHKIDLEPYEFLVKVCGTIGEFDGIKDLITSLTFVTNIGTYGPFGEVRGSCFDIPVHSNGCIVGFFARAETYVDAIGVYARPI